MPAKYLQTLGEERRPGPELHRQIGCVTGILQAFDRRYPIAAHHSHKRLLPPGLFLFLPGQFLPAHRNLLVYFVCIYLPLALLELCFWKIGQGFTYSHGLLLMHALVSWSSFILHSIARCWWQLLGSSLFPLISGASRRDAGI